MTQHRNSTCTTATDLSSSDWPCILRDNVTDIAELCRLLHLPSSAASPEAAAIQPLNVTRDYLSRMEPGNPDDPLLLQILPRSEELNTALDFVPDPLDESIHYKRIPTSSHCVTESNVTESNVTVSNGSETGHPVEKKVIHLPVIQKYPGRALILASDYCASHCRFCFRRHLRKKKSQSFPIRRANRDNVQFSTFLQHSIPQNNDETSDIREIILSGGDPLMLDDTELERIFHYIKDSHAGNRVRIHTRMPVMLPERVTPQLVAVLRDYLLAPNGGAVFVVLHTNHPNELSDKVIKAVALILDAGIPVLSQSVLLRGVNDRFETLYDLFEKLANHRMIPYYLHQLDRVQGATHFEVPTVKGQMLLSKLSAALPGYAVPQYVREIPGTSKKTRL